MLRQLLEYRQLVVTPQHDQAEACRTIFHFSPATQQITNKHSIHIITWFQKLIKASIVFIECFTFSNFFLILCQSKIETERQIKSSFLFFIKICQAPADPSLPRTSAMELDTGVCVGSFFLPEQKKH